MEKQRTIKESATISGIGLHTGRVVKLRLWPGEPDSGIVFVRKDLPGSPRIEVTPSNLKRFNGILRRTVLRNKRVEVHTTEHLLAALSGLSVDNIIIEIDNAEPPGFDGSAKDYVSILRNAGLEEQDAERTLIEIERPIITYDEDASIQVIPDERFRVEYFLDYDHPHLKEQWFDITFERSGDFIDFFEDEVAPARTFCIEKEALSLLKAGFGKGADFSNTLVIGIDGPINNTLRFPNEPARHKLLDLLGDLYILGRHIKGRVIAKKSGHKLNNIFVRKIQEEITKLQETITKQ